MIKIIWIHIALISLLLLSACRIAHTDSMGLVGMDVGVEVAPLSTHQKLTVEKDTVTGQPTNPATYAEAFFAIPSSKNIAHGAGLFILDRDDHSKSEFDQDATISVGTRFFATGIFYKYQYSTRMVDISLAPGFLSSNTSVSLWRLTEAESIEKDETRAYTLEIVRPAAFFKISSGIRLGYVRLGMWGMIVVSGAGESESELRDKSFQMDEIVLMKKLDAGHNAVSAGFDFTFMIPVVNSANERLAQRDAERSNREQKSKQPVVSPAVTVQPVKTPEKKPETVPVVPEQNVVPADEQPAEMEDVKSKLGDIFDRQKD